MGENLRSFASAGRRKTGRIARDAIDVPERGRFSEATLRVGATRQRVLGSPSCMDGKGGRVSETIFDVGRKGGSLINYGSSGEKTKSLPITSPYMGEKKLKKF